MANGNELPPIEYLGEEETKKLMTIFGNAKIGWVLVGEKKYFFPDKYAMQRSIYYNFEVNKDDTWIVTYPRSGTTWTQELVWLLSNNLDFETAKSMSLGTRFPFLENSSMMTDSAIANIRNQNQDKPDIESVISNIDLSHEIARSMPTPRFIKTHFPLSLVPNILKSNCKVIYVARNPKDVAVSYYHFHKTVVAYDYCGDFETFWNYFQNDRVTWSPYWEHIKEGWKRRHDPNFLFLFYEELNHDLLAATKKVAKFLGKSYSDKEYQKLVDHLTFNNFKNNKMVNLTKDTTTVLFKTDNFIRQGKSQAWHSMFSPQLNEQANNWIREHLNNTDIQFPFVDIYS